MENKEFYEFLSTVNGETTNSQIYLQLLKSEILKEGESLNKDETQWLSNFIYFIHDVKEKHNKRLVTDKKYAKRYTKFSVEDITKIISKIKDFNKDVLQDAGTLTLQKINQIIRSYDVQFISDMRIVYKVLTDKLRLNSKTANKITSQMIETLTNMRIDLNRKIKGSNEQITDFLHNKTGEFLHNIEDIVNLTKDYQTVKQDVENKEEYISSFFDNCVDRTKNYWRKSKVENLKPLLNKLQTCIYSGLENAEDNKFSVLDIVDLSEQCATLFIDGNDKKVDEVCEQIQLLRDFVLTHYKPSLYKQDVYNITKSISIKDVIKRAPTIATAEPENLKFSRLLLCGKTFNEALEEAYGDKLKSDDKDFYKEFSTVKVDADLFDLSRIYSGSISSLNITPDRVCSIVKFVNNQIKEGYNIDAYDRIISGNNFSQLNTIKIKEISEDSCLPELIKIFKEPDELLYYLNDNLALLNLPKDVVLNRLKAIFDQPQVDTFELQEKIKNALREQVTDISNTKVEKHRKYTRKRINAHAKILKNQKDYLPTVSSVEHMMDALNIDKNKKDAFTKGFVKKSDPEILDYIDKNQTKELSKEEQDEDLEYKKLAEEETEEDRILEEKLRLADIERQERERKETDAINFALKLDNNLNKVVKKIANINIDQITSQNLDENLKNHKYVTEKSVKYQTIVSKNGDALDLLEELDLKKEIIDKLNLITQKSESLTKSLVKFLDNKNKELQSIKNNRDYYNNIYQTMQQKEQAKEEALKLLPNINERLFEISVAEKT